MTHYILECCVDSVESALNAEKGGATRLELCAGLVLGGITPSPTLFEQIRLHTDIPIHVLVRPRFGDFLYTDEEFCMMEKEIVSFRKLGAQGVVIGCLTPEGNLNLPYLKRLCQAAGPLSITLHRAFDMCQDPFTALEQAVGLGMSAILTSGQATDCLAGLSLLKRLSQTANGRIAIMAGGGIASSTVATLLAETKITAFHMSGKKVLDSPMRYRNTRVNMGLPGLNEYQIWQTDPQQVAQVRRLLEENPPH